MALIRSKKPRRLFVIGSISVFSIIFWFVTTYITPTISNTIIEAITLTPSDLAERLEGRELSSFRSCLKYHGRQQI